MNYVLDTNILLHLLTGSDKGIAAQKEMEEQHPYLMISIVTKAEILSVAKQRDWEKRS